MKQLNEKPNLVDSPDKTVHTTPSFEADATAESPVAQSSHSMQEFYELKQNLQLMTLVITGLIVGPVWWVYGLNIALNYLLGAGTGLLYLRLLARNVERLGTESLQVGKSQLALFAGVLIVTTQIDSLMVLPVFLGFLTYKIAIIVFMLRTAFLPQSPLAK